ncbi:MAG: hypothetical protein ACRYHQ_41075 [Janthinobacterium lividum]
MDSEQPPKFMPDMRTSVQPPPHEDTAAIERALRAVLASYGFHLGGSAQPRGCICPAGAEAGCRGPYCPRLPFPPVGCAR